jgi:uncharacterized protein
MRLAALYRYPVKGLNAEALEKVMLSVGDPIPNDRRYAIENGPSGFDPAAPVHLPKIHFLMLMRHERLAALRSRFDDATTTLTIDHDGGVLQADLSRQEGRRRLEDFLARYLEDGLRGAPRVLEAQDFSFSDTARRVVSLINRASVQAIEDQVGAPVDPLRFRGNLLLEGPVAWAEFTWIGRELTAPSGLRLRVVDRIDRCAAVNVDPHAGLRDMNIPQTLMKTFGHVDCGVYAEVVQGGALAVGERLVLVEPRESSLF